jgi:hypothetical protein
MTEPLMKMAELKAFFFKIHLCIGWLPNLGIEQCLFIFHKYSPKRT